jgi:signal transduction histidine kinase
MMSSLRLGGVSLVVVAFLLGLLAAAVWLRSDARWNSHLQRAEFAGAVLYSSLQSAGAPPMGAQITALNAEDQARADRGRFDAISGVPHPALVTNLSIRSNPTSADRVQPLTLAILSPDLRYPLSSVSARAALSPSETMASVTRLMATFCSSPVMMAKSDGGQWLRIDAPQIWGCGAAPTDYRLIAVGMALVSLAILITRVLNSSAQFTEFAQRLRDRNRIGGPEVYTAEGVQELQDIVAAVNSHLEIERDRLSERAAVLSGVTHDLGTPATRLKLRTALIADAELRSKLESDIDKMTEIIESVLTYTRSELDAETPRQISLTSLIESIVDDYQDIGSPVVFQEADALSVLGGRSLFMSRQGTGSLPADDKVIITGRPVALGRAVSNLIDNALKYGRRATVGLEKDADYATIIVEDEGTTVTAQDVEVLAAPFKRGSNTKVIAGHGLGLTIVSSIANLHGGTMTFEPGARGLRVKITIRRQ